MLSFFRSSQFTVVVPLALYIVLLHLAALCGWIDQPPASAKEGVLFRSCFGWALGNAFFASLTATALVLFQSISINIVADDFRLTGDRNWFPGLFYALAASALPEFLFVSPVLVAATFIPFVIRAIYSCYQKPFVTAKVFDAALLVSIASLFYPPALWVLPGIFIGIGVIRSFKLQERLVFFTGALVPLFLGWVCFFLMDRGNEFRSVQWGSLINRIQLGWVWDFPTLFKTALVLLLALIFVFGLALLYSRKSIQVQKYITVQYWLLAAGGLSAFILPMWSWEHLLLSASAMGILLALTFFNIRNKFFAEIAHLCLLAWVFFIQFSHNVIGISIN